MVGLCNGSTLFSVRYELNNYLVMDFYFKTLGIAPEVLMGDMQTKCGWLQQKPAT
jgi:hypothetical protein